MSFFAFSLRYLYKSDAPGTDIPHIIAVAGSIIGFGIMWFFDRKKSSAFMSNVPGSRGNYRRLFTVLAAFSINIFSLFYYLAKSEFSTEMTLVNNLLNMNNSRVFVSMVSGALYAIISILFYAGLNILNPKKVIRQFNLRVFALFCSIVLILTVSYVRVFITHYTIFPKAAVLGGTGHTAGPWLTWHDDPGTAICVSWFTAEKKGTRMYYGKDPDNLNLPASGKDDVFLHKVFIENLSPGTTYYYRIHETFETPHSSVLFSFRTAPDVQRPFEFVVLGDMQPGDDITENANRIFIGELLTASDKDPFDFIIQLGDLTETGEDVEAWHRVLNNLSRISALHPTMTAIGNHEWGSRGNAAAPGDTGSSFALLFSYPYDNPEQGRYYSFNYLNAYFIALDPYEHYNRISKTQLGWLENELKQARASREIDWIFVFMHPSILSTGTTPVYFDLQETLIPLFDRYAVSAVFYGHDHHYEMYSYTYGGNGLLFDPSHQWFHSDVKYILTGSAGARLEIDYSVLKRRPYNYRRKWFSTADNVFQTKTYIRDPWNESRQIERVSEKFPDFDTPGQHTYHLSGEEIYQTDITDFGYIYGEQTMSYVRVRIDGTTCQISAHYPEGDLIRGPKADLPQFWTLTSR